MSKKPSCPQCNKKLNHLTLDSLEHVLFDVKLIGDHSYDFTFDRLDDANGKIESEVYSCPFCDEVLFKNDKDAAMFLKGESSKKEGGVL